MTVRISGPGFFFFFFYKYGNTLPLHRQKVFVLKRLQFFLVISVSLDLCSLMNLRTVKYNIVTSLTNVILNNRWYRKVIPYNETHIISSSEGNIKLLQNLNN